jgi:hypothetical protein
MDNFHIDITSDRNIEVALELAMRGRKAIAFKKTPTTLVLFWADHPEAQLLPVAMSADKIVTTVVEWLKTEAQYCPEPDTDGHCTKGWRVSCDDWGHIKPYGWQGLVRVEPVHAIHGK